MQLGPGESAEYNPEGVCNEDWLGHLDYWMIIILKAEISKDAIINCKLRKGKECSFVAITLWTVLWTILVKVWKPQIQEKILSELNYTEKEKKIRELAAFCTIVCRICIIPKKLNSTLSLISIHSVSNLDRRTIWSGTFECFICTLTTQPNA